MPIQHIPITAIQNNAPPSVPIRPKQTLISAYTSKPTNSTYTVKQETIKSELSNDSDVDALTDSLCTLNVAATTTPASKQTDTVQSNAHIPTCISQTQWIHDATNNTYKIVNIDAENKAFDDIQYKTYNLPATIYNKLYKHQQQCLQWLYTVHCNTISSKTIQTKYNAALGCVLADDMGLGKTVQLSAYISGLFNSKIATRVLIVVPVAVTTQWYTHLNEYCPSMRIKRFDIGTRKVRSEALQAIIDRGGILITTYGLINTCDTEFMNVHSTKAGAWDYVVCDEGHIIKNPNIQISKTLRAIPSVHRIILTGTPMQNHLDELWSLYDYVSHGTLLGSRQGFKQNYESVILAGQDKHANIHSKVLSDRISQQLRLLYQPYFLRREKSDINIQSLQSANDIQNNISNNNTNIQKNDLIVWLYLTELQSTLYRAFSESADVKALLNTSKSPLAALKVLQKICDHPRLLKAEMDTCTTVKLDFQPETIENTIQESGKLHICIELIKKLVSEQHRILVFSTSVKILNLIQNILLTLHITYTRIDGSVSGVDRQSRITTFNNSNINVFLLTTGAGGVGLNLTAADRVIIYDPNWNPSKDTQAVDRAFRIGQRKNVVVYRLITCGTIEEVMYRKQVFKQGLMRATIDIERSSDANKTNVRYFSSEELRSVFMLTEHNYSHTQQQLVTMHPPSHRKSYVELERHIKWLHTLNIFGISDHDLLFTQHESLDNNENINNDSLNESVADIDIQVQNATHALIQSRGTPATTTTQRKPTYSTAVRKQYTNIGVTPNRTVAVPTHDIHTLNTVPNAIQHNTPTKHASPPSYNSNTDIPVLDQSFEQPTYANPTPIKRHSTLPATPQPHDSPPPLSQGLSQRDNKDNTPVSPHITVPTPQSDKHTTFSTPRTITSCEQHKLLQFNEYTFVSNNCVCTTDAIRQQAYNQTYNTINRCTNKQEQLKAMLDCLEIQDSDPELHVATLALGSEIFT